MAGGRRGPNEEVEEEVEEDEEGEEAEAEAEEARETTPPTTGNTLKTSSHSRTSSRSLEDDSQEAAGKYRRYEKEYLRRINHKYFSAMALSGEPVFETSISIDAFLFKESKESPLKKFVDGPSLVEDNGRSGDAAPSSRRNINRKN